ncbi:MAG: hypothetical protein A2Y10_00315 [Planctomycetes bacterium GWF2_41_51]|nr:MAG: hypothetical protein A2Y10_00315 [Planctomycetes bacterium GWF2_41_51]
MKKLVLVALVLAISGIAGAAVNVPVNGLTGLWTFGADWTAPIVGQPLSGVVGNGNQSVPWVEIGTVANGGLYSNGLGAQMFSADTYVTVNPSFAANGGGSYVNEYTIAFDYAQTDGGSVGGVNGLFQSAWDHIGSSAELFNKKTSEGNFIIGHDSTGWSTATFNATQWHRYMISVDNGNFFRVYVDGVLLLDGTAQGVDGTYSLYIDRFHLLEGDWNWGNDRWGYISTIATWGRALSTSEIGAMGGWIGGAATPTALIVPEPATLAILALGGLLLRRKK